MRIIRFSIRKGVFLRILFEGLALLLLAFVFFISCLLLTGCPEAQQVMPPVVSDPSDPTEEPAKPPVTTVGDEKQEPETPAEEPTTEPAEPKTQAEEPVEEPVSTVTLPPGYELPPELIPATPPTLSKDEAALIEADKWVKQNHPDFDVTAPELVTQAGHTADLISLLPHKEREEVYDLFVASINLPSFAKAAQRLWEINTQLRILDGEAERTGDWDEYYVYYGKISVELGFLDSQHLNTLADIYFEENPEDEPYRHEGISYYWILIEYYRLQLENPKLPNLIQKNNPTELLNLFRQSCRKGYIFGLDNPLS